MSVTLHEHLRAFIIVSRRILPEMERVSCESVENNHTVHINCIFVKIVPFKRHEKCGKPGCNSSKKQGDVKKNEVT